MTTIAQYNASKAIECPICKAGSTCNCIGLDTPNTTHMARLHLFQASQRPLPDAAAIAELTARVGTRPDTRPFIAWLDGQHEFRTASSAQAGALAARVFRVDNYARAITAVRRTLLDLALRHGLVVSHSEGGRGRWVVTERGLRFHAEHALARSA